jgi:2-oxoglutarate ferredoxin oxidoreductase subunit beta
MATTPSTPAPKLNRIGLSVLEYKGGKTTLCAGCGHNAISERIVDAMYEMGVKPERVAKLSGIGCSSKSPAYFMSRSHSFNSVHGRMPSVATGAMLANRNLLALGVSGDGDSASIGIGQFVHLMRRNLPMIYIIEDNGVYGLTKGQFSATADLGSKLKTGVVNDLPAIDTCALAIELGATFVGRSFSGDKRQLHSMLKAAISHKGTVMLDVISPCVTFNDHDGSTKSYRYMKDRCRTSTSCRTSRRSTSSTTRAQPSRSRCTTARGCGCASSRKATIPRTGLTPSTDCSKHTKSRKC